MSPSGSAPVILIVGRLAREAKGVRGAPFAAGQRYFQAVARGGGVPLMLPPITELVDEMPALLRRVDGVALHGGGDIDPRHYGQEATAEQLYGIVPSSTRSCWPWCGRRWRRTCRCWRSAAACRC